MEKAIRDSDLGREPQQRGHPAAHRPAADDRGAPPRHDQGRPAQGRGRQGRHPQRAAQGQGRARPHRQGRRGRRGRRPPGREGARRPHPPVRRPHRRARSSTRKPSCSRSDVLRSTPRGWHDPPPDRLRRPAARDDLRPRRSSRPGRRRQPCPSRATGAARRCRARTRTRAVDPELDAPSSTGPARPGTSDGRGWSRRPAPRPRRDAASDREPPSGTGTEWPVDPGATADDRRPAAGRRFDDPAVAPRRVARRRRRRRRRSDAVRRAGRRRPAGPGATCPPRSASACGLGAVVLASLFLWRPAVPRRGRGRRRRSASGRWSGRSASAGANPPLIPLIAGGVLMVGLAWYGGRRRAHPRPGRSTVLAAMVWRLADGPRRLPARRRPRPC